MAARARTPAQTAPANQPDCPVWIRGRQSCLSINCKPAMKTSHLTAVPAAALALFLALLPTGTARAQASDPSRPVGSLSAFPTVVRTGTYPTLTWNISYPSLVLDYITRDPDGTLTPKRDLYMDVRILGASYQIGTYSDGTPKWGTVESYVRADGATSFTRIFQGIQTQISPTKIYYTKLCHSGRAIDFRSRCYNGSSWLSYRSTESLTANVVALVNGERPPDTVPAFQQQNIEAFLRPYLDSEGKLMIGPLDVVYLFELGQTNTSSSGFDLQDLVLLVTFRTA
jgi:hypothetical protein